MLCYSVGFGSLQYQLLRDERERKQNAEGDKACDQEDSGDAKAKLAEATVRQSAPMLGPDAPGVPKLKKKKRVKKDDVKQDDAKQKGDTTSDDDSDHDDDQKAKKRPPGQLSRTFDRLKRLKNGLGGKIHIPGMGSDKGSDDDEDEDEEEAEREGFAMKYSFAGLIWDQANIPHVTLTHTTRMCACVYTYIQERHPQRQARICSFMLALVRVRTHARARAHARTRTHGRLRSGRSCASGLSSCTFERCGSLCCMSYSRCSV